MKCVLRFGGRAYLVRTSHPCNTLSRDNKIGPRTIELRCNYALRNPLVDDDLNIEMIHAITQIPPTLHVCHESRAEALKVYQLSFGISTPTSPTSSLYNPSRDMDNRIYVNLREIQSTLAHGGSLRVCGMINSSVMNACASRWKSVPAPAHLRWTQHTHIGSLKSES
jgi:hypothetical protein